MGTLSVVSFIHDFNDLTRTWKASICSSQEDTASFLDTEIIDKFKPQKGDTPKD